MKKLFFIWLCLVLQAWAATKHVAQSSAGANDGSSAANAYSIAQLNAASPYSPAAGDTVVLNGTFTTQLVPPTSGSSGNPITYQFASGAKFSKAYWSTSPNGAIYINGKNYITIDGGTADNGVIENTANGTALANQQNSNGISINGGSNITLKNLYVSLYQRTPDTDDSTGSAGVGIKGVYVVSCNNLLIEDCTIADCKLGTDIYQDGVTGTTIIRNSSFPRDSTHIQITTGNNNCTGTVSIYGNTFSDGYYWDYATPALDIFHNDGIHMFTGTGDFSRVEIYQNDMFADYGAHCTGVIFLEGDYGDVVIYSNLIGTKAQKFEGAVNVSSRSTGSTLVLNGNTFRGGGTSAPTGGNAVYINDQDGGEWTSIVAYNNIFYNFYTVWAIPDDNATSAFDLNYNSYYNISNFSGRYTPPASDQTGSSGTLAAWKTYLGGASDEVNSITTNPLFTNEASDLTLQSGSPAKDTGATLSSPYNVTVLGNTRTGSFDMGAYEFGESSGATTPAVSSATINSAGTSLTLNLSESCTTGGGGSGGVTLSASGGAVTASYSSGSGSTAYVYTTSRTILIGETVTVSYTQPGSGIESTDDQTDLASFSGTSVTNNSTQTATITPARGIRPVSAISAGSL